MRTSWRQGMRAPLRKRRSARVTSGEDADSPKSRNARLATGKHRGGMPSQPTATWITPWSSRSVNVAGTWPRRQTIGLMPTSQTLTCRTALAFAAGSEKGTTATEGFSRRFIRPDYRLSAHPSPDTPGILMFSVPIPPPSGAPESGYPRRPRRRAARFVGGPLPGLRDRPACPDGLALRTALAAPSFTCC